MFKLEIHVSYIPLNFPKGLRDALDGAFDDYLYETEHELDDAAFDDIQHVAQRFWHEDWKEVELWVNEYGLVQAMREAKSCGFIDSYAKFLKDCDAQGDRFSRAHDEKFYVLLLSTIMYVVLKAYEEEDESDDSVETVEDPDLVYKLNCVDLVD
jgi:hypothetical protein